MRIAAVLSALGLTLAASLSSAATIGVASVGAWNNWYQGSATASVRDFAVQAPGDYLFTFSLVPDSALEPNLASLHATASNFASLLDAQAHDVAAVANVGANSFSGNYSFHADQAGLFRFDLGFTNGGVWGPANTYYDQIWNGTLNANLTSTAPPAPAPVPEPASIALLGLGMLVLLARRPRRQTVPISV